MCTEHLQICEYGHWSQCLLIYLHITKLTCKQTLGKYPRFKAPLLSRMQRKQDRPH